MARKRSRNSVYFAVITALTAILISCTDSPATAGFGDPPTPETCFCSPDGVEAYLRWAAAAYPEITELRSIGVTALGRDIFALEVSDKPGSPEAEPAVLVNGAIHGHEQAGAGVVLKLIEYLCSGYYSGNISAKGLVSGYKLHFIPVLNPDGLEDSDRYNSSGVDLNRNFAYNWYEDEEFNGNAAFDQAESRAVRDDMLMHGYCLSLNMHTSSTAGGIGIYGPWDAVPVGGDENSFISEYLPNYRFIKTAGEAYSSEVVSTGTYPFDTYFHYLEGADWYPLYGSVGDWALGTQGTLPYSIELYAKQNFTVADAGLLDQIWTVHRDAITGLLAKAGLGSGGRLTDSTGKPIGSAEIRLTTTPAGRSFIPQPYTELRGLTDGNGYFRLLTGAGSYHISFSSGTRSTGSDIEVDGSGGTSVEGGAFSSFPSYILP